MSLYDYATARNITADAQGRLMAFACGTNNLMAPVIEALSQNGYSIYANEDGTTNIVQDMDTKGGTTWRSSVFGMDFGYDPNSGTVKMSPIDPNAGSAVGDTTSAGNGTGNTGASGALGSVSSSINCGSSSPQSIFAAVSGTYNPYSQYGITGSSQSGNIDSLYAYNQSILDAYFASRQQEDKSGKVDGQEGNSDQDGQALSDEYIKELEELSESKTIDERTGYVVNKEKSDAIDELASNSAKQYKFDQIAKAIEDVEKTQKVKPKEVEKSDNSSTWALCGGAAGAAIGGVLVAKAKAFVGGLKNTSKLASFIGKIPGWGKVAAGALVVGGMIAGGTALGLKVSNIDKGNAKEIDENSKKEAAKKATSAGENLKEQLDSLLKQDNPEELIAFERYYYDNYGVSLSDKLRELDVTDSDSEIAQQSGINSEYLLGTKEEQKAAAKNNGNANGEEQNEPAGILAKIDKANKYLEPEKLANVQQAAVKSAQNSIEEKNNETKDEDTTTELTSKEQIQINNLYKKLNVYQKAWDAANNGSKVSIDGETKTFEEIEQLLLETADKIDKFKAAKENGEDTSTIY